MLPPRGLDTFFAALREAKIFVGPREVLRVHEVLARAEHLDARGLHAVLAAILVKSREDKQRFDDLYRAFVAVPDDLEMRGEEPPSVTPKVAPTNPSVQPERAPEKPRLSRRTIFTAAAVLGALTVGAFVATRFGANNHPRSHADLADVSDAGYSDAEPRASITDGATADAEPEPDFADAHDFNHPDPVEEDVEKPVSIAVEQLPNAADPRVFSTLVPKIEVRPQHFYSSIQGFMAGLGLFAIFASAGATIWARRRKMLPPRAPAPTKQGPPVLPLSIPVARDLELLDMRSEDALVWGIGKFVTDDITTTLDIERTVAATVANAGRPELRFERRGRHRRVCIWIDESSNDATMERFGRELSLALSRVGLDVEVARYWAVPDKLTRSDGSTFTPAELEEELAFAIIAILTDGQALTMRHAGADRRLGISRLFRIFARLPRMAFVDFGEGPTRASRLASAYGITSVRPDEAAAFLALGRKPELRDAPARKLSGDATAWAAACAFGMCPIDEETAYHIRRSLGLAISPWYWPIIRKSCQPVGALLDWTSGKRAELLDWLRRAERGTEGVLVEPASLLGKTLTYWKNRLDADAMTRTQNDARQPWIGTPAERAHRIDRALLDLWDRPEDAVRTLYSFVGTDAEASVKGKLRDYRALEAEGMRDVVVLPWRFADLSDASQAMLERIGFGRDKAERDEGDLVERRGRMWLGFGLAFGMGVGIVLAGVKSWQAKTFPCVVESVEGCGGFCEEIPQANGSRAVIGGLAGFSSQTEAGRTDLPAVTFVNNRVQCEETNARGWRILRCGHDVPSEKPERTSDPRRRVFVIVGDLADERLRSLANSFLDRRIADVVLTMPTPAENDVVHEYLPAFDPKHDQLVEVCALKEGCSGLVSSSLESAHLFAVDLPLPARVMKLPDKPVQAWYGYLERINVLTAHQDIIEIDGENRAIERKVFEPPPAGVLWPVADPLKTTRAIGYHKVGEMGVTLERLSAPYSWMSWQPKGLGVVFKTDDGNYHVVDTTHTRRSLPSSLNKNLLVGPVVWRDDGQGFAGVSESGTILAWSSASDFMPEEYTALMKDKPSSVSWSISGNELIVGTESGVKMLVEQGGVISFPGLDQPISAIVGPVASKYLFVSAKLGKVFLAESTQVGAMAPTLRVLQEIRALTGAISPFGQVLATVHEGGKIRVATLAGVELNSLACDTQQAPRWSEDGKHLLAICGDKVVEFSSLSPYLGVRARGGACLDQEKLVDGLGAKTSEAKLMVELCEETKKR